MQHPADYLRLLRHPPEHRRGYSDRTAWLMACLSELAYLRYEPPSPPPANDTQRKKQSLLEKTLAEPYDPKEQMATLRTELKKLGAQLLWAGDKNGTQCILVQCKQFNALAFRGTEIHSIKDISSDIKANKTNAKNGGLIHYGFKNAYDKIKNDIKKQLQKIENKPLYITGHSLGGAIANIAAMQLQDSLNVAACYTFGAPKVGDKEWVANIRAPVYRIVNAMDAVTVLPPSRIFTNGYMHSGDMRYLTATHPEEYHKVKLLPYVGIINRIKIQIKAKWKTKNLLTDHKISEYRKKLFAIAKRHNS